VADKIDLTAPQPCGTKKVASNEIVVCAHRGDGSGPYRLKQLPPNARAVIPRAAVTLANGVVASADAQRGDVGGFPSNRLMVGVKIKF
jgi:hypothetical protein